MERQREVRGEAASPTDAGSVGAADRAESTAADGSVSSRLRRRAGSLFSLRPFALAALACLAGTILVGGVVPFEVVGELLGFAAGGFGYGLLAGRRRYTEVALAGALVGGGSAFLDHLPLALLGVGVPLVALGVFAGLLAAVGGYYLGRDLRDGLTRPL